MVLSCSVFKLHLSLEVEATKGSSLLVFLGVLDSITRCCPAGGPKARDGRYGEEKKVAALK